MSLGKLLALLLWFPVPVATAADTVRLTGYSLDITESAPAPAAVFGNRDLPIHLGIEGTTAEPASLRGDLLQIAGDLAMPLTKDMPLLAGITFPGGSPQTLVTSVKLPEVKRRTAMLVRLRLISGGAKAISIPLTDVRLSVFPASITKELTDLFKPKMDGASRLVIFGPGKKLRHFLSDLKVVFEDGGEGIPDRFEADRLYFGELSSATQFRQAQDRKGGARQALFFDDESLPPGIYASTSGAESLVTVSLPMLNHLADDPLAQLALIKITDILSTNPSQ